MESIGEDSIWGNLYLQRHCGISRDSKGCRAVGMANNRNPIVIVVPCHRVIGMNGSLTGYAGGLEMKEYLLDLEKRNQKLKERY